MKLWKATLVNGMIAFYNATTLLGAAEQADDSGLGTIVKVEFEMCLHEYDEYDEPLTDNSDCEFADWS